MIFFFEDFSNDKNSIRVLQTELNAENDQIVVSSNVEHEEKKKKKKKEKN